MSEAEIWDFVASAHTGILTTVRRDNTPVAMPVWFMCLDHSIYVRTRGKKLARLRHNPRASFLVETGERWAELAAVHMTGTAAVAEPAPGLRSRIEAEIDRKYAPYRGNQSAETRAHYEAAGFALVCFVPDDRVLSWDNARIAQS